MTRGLSNDEFCFNSESIPGPGDDDILSASSLFKVLLTSLECRLHLWFLLVNVLNLGEATDIGQSWCDFWDLGWLILRWERERGVVGGAKKNKEILAMK